MDERVLNLRREETVRGRFPPRGIVIFESVLCTFFGFRRNRGFFTVVDENSDGVSLNSVDLGEGEEKRKRRYGLRETDSRLNRAQSRF